MDNITLALMCGTDIPIPETQLILHQPKIKEIAMFGEERFYEAIQYFCINKNMLNQDKSLLENISNFQIFMTIMNEKQARDKKLLVEDIAQMLFPKTSKLTFLPTSILFSGNGMQISIDENNFDQIPLFIKKICCLNKGENAQFDAVDAKAQEIANKIQRGRARVAQEKGGNSSILSQYISSLAVGLNSMSLQDLMDLTIFQLFNLIERYQLYIAWDIDIRSRLAGAKLDKQPDNWMRDIN